MENISVRDLLRFNVVGLKSKVINDNVKVKGHVLIIIRDAKTLKELKRYEFDNVITTNGLAMFAEAMAKRSFNYYWFLVLGTGSGTPSSSDTSLFTPVPSTAKTGTLTQSANSYTYYVRYMPEEANGYTYTELGIYDKCTSNTDYTTGLLLNHLMISPTITKDSSILVDFYVTITFS